MNKCVKFFQILICLLCASVFASSKEDDLLPCVSSIAARQSQKAGEITLSWTLPEGKSRALVSFYAIYRDTRPIYSTTRLKSLVPIGAATKNTVSYTDSVVDGQQYYYAVISFINDKSSVSSYEQLYYDEEVDKELSSYDDEGTLYAVILPGVNSTITGIAAASEEKVFLEKETILAEKNPASGAEKVNEPAEKNEVQTFQSYQGAVQGNVIEHKISKTANDKVSSLLSSNKKKETKRILDKHIFAEDFVEPSGGDDYLLYDALSKSFLKNDYTLSVSLLTDFLSRRHDAAVVSRATFYLGESYYFSGSYGVALKYFSLLKDVYPALSAKWSDSCIDLY